MSAVESFSMLSPTFTSSEAMFGVARFEDDGDLAVPAM